MLSRSITGKNIEFPAGCTHVQLPSRCPNKLAMVLQYMCPILHLSCSRKFKILSCLRFLLMACSTYLESPWIINNMIEDLWGWRVHSGRVVNHDSSAFMKNTAAVSSEEMVNLSFQIVRFVWVTINSVELSQQVAKSNHKLCSLCCTSCFYCQGQ